MFQHPWMPLIPALPILIASLAVNYLGDGLRDALDPRQKV
jgi:peptide/nickel transport system permease protein